MGKYRVFIDDVRPTRYGKNFKLGAFSCLCDRSAQSSRRAAVAVAKETEIPITRLIALPHRYRDLWPDGKTGEIDYATWERYR